MKLKTYHTEARGNNPYENLALEEYLLDRVGQDEVILYLWQNQQTVVIGKNQNPWAECKIEALESHGGRMARRPSGGGAVYHDMGNLNFTFILKKKHYNVEKQLSVITKAVNALGINAIPSGRNDITVDGRKFSGNAFFTRGGNSYHHGTILVDVDKSVLSKYLNVSKDKLKSKGVKSVRSRVVNLKELKKEITIDIIKSELIKAFSEVYGTRAQTLDYIDLKKDEIQVLIQKYQSWEWRLGRKIPFNYEISKRFPWGNINVQLQVNEGVIKDLMIYSDAMNLEVIRDLKKDLKNTRYEEEKIISKIDLLKEKHIHKQEIIEDIKNLFLEKQ